MIHAHDSVIVRTMSRLLIPLIQLFALYVLFFGQDGPGGGFVGGVMLGASLILGILVFGPEAAPCRLARKLVHGDGIGLMIFAGIGGLCLIGGGEFLNYSNLEIPWARCRLTPALSGHSTDTNRGCRRYRRNRNRDCF